MSLIKRVLFLPLIFIFACTQAPVNRLSEGTLIPNEYAKLFQLQTTQTDTILTIYGQDHNKIGSYFWGRSQTLPNIRKIHLNQKIISLSVVFSRWLSFLDAENQIVAVDNIDFHPTDIPLNKDIQSIKRGNVLNQEALWSINPGLVFSYQLNGQKPEDTRWQKQDSVNFIWIQAHLESHPLARAEWIRAIGWLIGKPRLSDSIYTEIAKRYQKNCIDSDYEKKPIVMLNVPYEGIWYVPQEKAFTTQLFRDAGYSTAWLTENKSTGTGASTISLEDAVRHIESADYWMHLGAAKNRTELFELEPRLRSVVLHKTKLFQFDAKLEANNANPFWDLGACRPDMVLRDLISIRNGQSDSSLYFYRRF